jgi:hypothetical protein
MTSWSIMFYNIHFFSFFEKIAQVTNLLYDDKNDQEYIAKDNSCYKKTTDVGGDVDQSHTAKNFSF